MSTDFDPVEFGRMQAEISNLKLSVDKLNNSVERLTDALSETKGGWKALVAVGSLIITISGGVAWFVTKFKLGV
jgi:hypothetical protein